MKPRYQINVQLSEEEALRLEIFRKNSDMNYAKIFMAGIDAIESKKENQKNS